MVQDVDEIGHVEPRFPGFHAHCEFVAEVASGGLSHAWNAQVLTQQGGNLDIEVVERYDPVEDASAGEIADGIHRMRAVPFVILVGHVEDLVDRIHRKFRLALEAQGCDEHYPRALTFRLGQEVVAFVVAREAEDSHYAIKAADAPTHSMPLL